MSSVSHKAKTPRSRRPESFAYGRVIVVAALLPLTGCGTNVQQLLFQAAAATGRTALDLLLTDVANAAADALEQVDVSPPPDTGGDTMDEPADMEAGGDETTTDATGDVTAGQDFFTSRGCTACHCADASGGCALDAPSLVGADTGTIEAALRPGGMHAGGPADLTAQQFADLAAFFASF